MIFHFIITIVASGDDFTVEGLYEAAPGKTRQAAYLELLDVARNEAVKAGFRVGKAPTRHFSLEPNDLTGGAR